jgi:hypothetical protein
MINAKFRRAENDTTSPNVPFLWKAASGCVYLRNEDHKDVIIAPNVSDGKVGRVVPIPATDTHEAWRRRLGPCDIVTLGNKP